jgi:hypothetical protein
MVAKERKLYWSEGTGTIVDLNSHRLPKTLDNMLEQHDHDADADAQAVWA